jgi:hypothetical protein
MIQEDEILEEIWKNYKKEKVINLQERKISQYYYTNEIFRTKVNKLKIKFKTDIWISLRYLNTIKNINMLNYVTKLDISQCKKILDIGCLHNLHTLSIHSENNIKDIGNLRKLKILVINGKKDIEGIHLLKNLDELIIQEYYSKKIKKRIKKLKKINKNIKITDLTIEILY